MPGCAAATGDFPTQPAMSNGTTVGHGDGRIHVIPTLSQPSLKNGEKFTISAVVKAEMGVATIMADIGGIELVTLKPASQQLGGVNALGTIGMWSAEWTGHGLEEKNYTIILRVRDRAGHTFEDRSLHFSDPIAGLSTPGSTAYPNRALQRIGSTVLDSYEESLTCAVLDVARGYAYFGTYTSPGIVVKVVIGPGNTSPSRVGGTDDPGATPLKAGENNLACAVIDPGAGYAYFGTFTSPGIVVKIALGAGNAPPSRVSGTDDVGAMPLKSGENNLACAVIDPDAGYAYFGTETIPGIVVKVALGSGNAPPGRSSGTDDVGTTPLKTGEYNLSCAVINTSAGYAYFGTSTNPGIVVKVALGAGNAPPKRVGGTDDVGATPLKTGENDLSCAAIDSVAGYAYFGTNTSPGIVVKVALGAGTAPPSRVSGTDDVGATPLQTGDEYLRSAVIDPTAGYAYFGTYNNGPIKVALGTKNAPPAYVGRAVVTEYEVCQLSAVIDPVAGYAYFGTYTRPGIVLKVALGAGNELPTCVGGTDSAGAPFKTGEGALFSSVFDPLSGYAYFGSYSDPVKPAVLVKVALGAANAPPRRVSGTDDHGATPLQSLESSLACGVIDPVAGYAYFGTTYGVVVKVALGTGNSPPSRVGGTSDPGAQPLKSSEYGLGCAVIDPVAGYAWFGTTSTLPGIVVKVALGAGNAPPSRVGGTDDVGATPLKTGENNLSCAVIDPLAGYAYFGTRTTPGIVVKVALGVGDAPPSRVSGTDDVGATPLKTGENYLSCAVIDPVPGYAYFGTETSPGIVVKVALGSGNAPPKRVGATDDVAAMHLTQLESYLASAVIDPVAGCAYFGTNTSPGIVVKVALGAGNAPPSRVAGTDDLGATPLNADESYLTCAIIDPIAGYSYFGGYTNAPSGTSGIVVKVALSPESSVIKASRIAVPEDATLTAVHFYSHRATGHLRLGIYDNSSPRHLVWQSTLIPNVPLPVTDPKFPNEVIVPISAGTPSVVALPEGTYWLSWQLDTTADVSSYTQGSVGDGFYLYQPFGAFPGSLGTEILSNERWTEYVEYFPQPHFAISGAATQIAGHSQAITISAVRPQGVLSTSYTGDYPITFSGANPGTNPPGVPTATDKNGVAIPFGLPTILTFVNGEVTTNITLFKPETAVISVTDGADITSAPLSVTVSAPPLITSPLAAGGMIGAPFSYTLTSVGSGTIRYDATSLPSGLSLIGQTISGTPAPGVPVLNPISLTATSIVPPADTQTLNLIILPEMITGTVAGGGTETGDGGPANSAALLTPFGVALDATGNIFIADSKANKVRRVDALTNAITTFAGTGTAGFSGNGQAATSAQLSAPSAVAVNSSGTLYIADFGNNLIRKVAPNGIISTYAGGGSNATISGSMSSVSISLSNPSGIALDVAGNLYIADRGNHRVLKVDTAQNVSLFAGSGVPGFNGDGPAAQTQFSSPSGVAVDASGGVYIADRDNELIRAVVNGVVLTIAGTPQKSGFSGDGGLPGNARLSAPSALAVDVQGDIYVSDLQNNRIRQIIPAKSSLLGGTTAIVSVAGTGVPGFSGNGSASLTAAFNAPEGLAVDASGRILVCDTGNNQVRSIDKPVPPTIISGPIATPNPAQVNTPVAFICAAKATSGLTWAWDFGDGQKDITNTSAPVHTFTAVGTYGVTATAIDQSGFKVQASVSVQINTFSGQASKVPSEILVGLGLDPSNLNTSPLGSDEASKIHVIKGMAVTALKLNYKASGKDLMSLKLNIPLVAQPTMPSQMVLDFGGIVRTFNLTPKGNSIVATATPPSKNDALKVKFSNSTLVATGTFKNGSFVNTLKNINGFGLTDVNSPTRTPRPSFYMLYGGELYEDLKFPISYKVNMKNGTGVGKQQ
jgi:sugar lactone lactonase YvrE